VPDRNHFLVWKALLTLVVLLLGADRALAYVGPGAGLEFVGYFLSLAAWVGVALSTVLLWPVYALLRRIRAPREKAPDAPPAAGLQESASAGTPANP
jgi:hypothetical protein